MRRTTRTVRRFLCRADRPAAAASLCAKRQRLLPSAAGGLLDVGAQGPSAPGDRRGGARYQLWLALFPAAPRPVPCCAISRYVLCSVAFSLGPVGRLVLRPRGAAYATLAGKSAAEPAPPASVLAAVIPRHAVAASTPAAAPAPAATRLVTYADGTTSDGAPACLPHLPFPPAGVQLTRALESCFSRNGQKTEENIGSIQLLFCLCTCEDSLNRKQSRRACTSLSSLSNRTEILDGIVPL